MVSGPSICRQTRSKLGKWHHLLLVAYLWRYDDVWLTSPRILFLSWRSSESPSPKMKWMSWFVYQTENKLLITGMRGVGWFHRPLPDCVSIKSPSCTTSLLHHLWSRNYQKSICRAMWKWKSKCFSIRICAVFCLSPAGEQQINQCVLCNFWSGGGYWELGLSV